MGFTLTPRYPIARLATMMGNGQYLYGPNYFTIDDVKVKNLEHRTSNIRRKNNTKAIGRRTNRRQDILEVVVVSTSQSRLYLLVVRDLLFVLLGGLGMEPIFHFKSA